MFAVCVTGCSPVSSEGIIPLYILAGLKEEKMEKPEEMKDFFNSRAQTYDLHMLEELNLREFYDAIAEYFPKGPPNAQILDIGCGTGLEISNIFLSAPNAQITCIDISDKMLEKLLEKFKEKKDQLHIMCASYFDVEYGFSKYDWAISTYSLHHFSPDSKLSLYKKIYNSLKPNAVYIEGDYTVRTKDKEVYFQKESERIRKANNISTGLYHYDTPLSNDTQIRLFLEAGFKIAEIRKQWDNTAVFTCVKI